MFVKIPVARLGAAAVIAIVAAQCSFGQFFGSPKKPSGPWMDKSLSPDQRAELVLKEMTLEEEIQLVHGTGIAGFGKPDPA